MIPKQFEAVERAFSKQSRYFDDYDRGNRILVDLRLQVREHVMKFLKKGNKMLELNAGTGLDASFFARLGCNVWAIDIAEGMVQALGKKRTSLDLYEQLNVKQLSYTQLDQLGEQGFDYVFSNFGGLNCLKDLREVTAQLSVLLRPEAYVTWVLMPPYYLWEWLTVFAGRWNYGLRRFKKKTVLAHLEGEYFPTYYHSPKSAIRAFGADFKTIALEGMSVLSPPPDREKFPEKYPALYQFLRKMDRKVRKLYPFYGWSDHYILTMQYCPEKPPVENTIK